MRQFSVTIYPVSSSVYVSQFYAGLFELRAMGKVGIRFGRRPVMSPSPFVFRFDVDCPLVDRPVRVCLDSADWRDLASPADLQDCDVYFKRSYHSAHLYRLYPTLRHKLRPMGLHYGVSSRNESFIDTVKLKLAETQEPHTLLRRPLFAAMQLVGSPSRRLLQRWGVTRLSGPPPFVDQFETTPDVPAKAGIFYRTRVYSPKEAPEFARSGRLDDLNDLRANTLRLLKRHFGDRFVGGLRHSNFAREHYGDCLSANDPGLAGHLALSKSHLINVTTAGLHDSTSWKIPEYVAASRCIVSEPMVAETTAPLLDGTHYLSFSTPGQCVAACETLLVDTGRTRAMREENHRYYKAFVRPDRLMQRCLHTAVATHADHAATPID